MSGMDHISPEAAGNGVLGDFLHMVWFVALINGWVPRWLSPCGRCRSVAAAATASSDATEDVGGSG